MLISDLDKLVKEIEQHSEWSRDDIVDFLNRLIVAEKSALEVIAEEQKNGYWTKPGRWF